MSDRTAILEEKRALRARMLAWRSALGDSERAQAASALAGHSLRFLGDIPNAAIVSGFASLPDELDARPLLERLAGEGFRLALPSVEGKGRPLVFRAWAPGDAMDEGVWGIAQPKADNAVVEPDILLVPLLAFDRRGWRLGYGGGFYDRTLQRLRGLKPVVAVGLAYDGQRIDAVPHVVDYDQRLDWVLTPSGPVSCAD